MGTVYAVYISELHFMKRVQSGLRTCYIFIFRSNNTGVPQDCAHVQMCRVTKTVIEHWPSISETCTACSMLINLEVMSIHSRLGMHKISQHPPNNLIVTKSTRGMLEIIR